MGYGVTSGMLWKTGAHRILQILIKRKALPVFKMIRTS